jgi:hypothetical protein
MMSQARVGTTVDAEFHTSKSPQTQILTLTLWFVAEAQDSGKLSSTQILFMPSEVYSPSQCPIDAQINIVLLHRHK